MLSTSVQNDNTYTLIIKAISTFVLFFKNRKELFYNFFNKKQHFNYNSKEKFTCNQILQLINQSTNYILCI